MPGRARRPAGIKESATQVRLPVGAFIIKVLLSARNYKQLFVIDSSP